jgi:predicted RecB family nuclease
VRPITGTHVYGLFHCARAVALDLSEDRSRRRALRDEEEFVRARGREHEARVVERLGWPAPEYPDGDFAAGAAATAAMLADGVPGVAQAVLQHADRLGIADLLRREPGNSRLGDWLYVVGDVKSSGRARGDQILQVAFYSELLAELQGAAPPYGFLVLKDGREERFALAPYEAALAEAVASVRELRADPTRERPFASRACESCHWSELCLPELQDRDDLSLVHGMTRGVRAVLERARVRTTAALAKASVDTLVRRTNLEPALLRRLRRAAEARRDGRPIREPRAGEKPLGPGAFVHLLTDPFEDRVLFLGALVPDDRGDGFHHACPVSREAEWPAFCELLARLPRHLALLHYGGALPRWFEEHSFGRVGAPALEHRFVDVARHVRGAAVFPAPVFDFADHVRYGLGLDPHRHGRAEGAALRASEPDGPGWLVQKGRADLDDLRVLARTLLSTDADEP